MNRTSPYRELPIVARMAGGFRWYLANGSWTSWAQRTNSELLCKWQSAEGSEILGKADKRLIFRLRSLGADSPQQSVVVKAFPMSKRLNYTGLKMWLFRYRRYGLAEARNLLEAARRGLPVPQVYGYARMQRGPLVLNTMVMMEDLAPRCQMRKLLAESQGQDRRQEELLDQVVPVFVQLYCKRCNHIDVNTTSIWLSDNAEAGWKISDFQFARFLEEPSPKALMFQAAYFARHCSDECAVPAKILQAWVEQLIAAADITNTDYWLDVYRKFQNLDLSNMPEAQRLAIQ